MSVIFLAFQKPVVDLHTEIIDLCSTSPSLFVIYIFPYSLNTVIVPLSVFVLLLLYTVPSGLAGEIGMIWFTFLITVKAVWSGWASNKCKVQTFGHAPAQSSVAAWRVRWVTLWLWPGWRVVTLFASLCAGEAPRCAQGGDSSARMSRRCCREQAPNRHSLFQLLWNSCHRLGLSWLAAPKSAFESVPFQTGHWQCRPTLEYFWIGFASF